MIKLLLVKVGVFKKIMKQIIYFLLVIILFLLLYKCGNKPVYNNETFNEVCPEYKENLEKLPSVRYIPIRK